ncbi:MAG: Uma2 family endonuclease [Chloroflexi bacterium]|nr:Uma2 family endonuclease [Chloroflexota bacterium]
MAVISTPLTLEEFLQLPEEEPALEFAEGLVTQKVSPKGRHSTLQGELIKQLDRAGLPHKVARAFPELRATFAGVSRVPDIAVYRWDRIPVDARGEVTDVFTVPPDIAIEIVSPEQSVNALVRRCYWYVANGVQVALLVDPADRSVLAFRPNLPASAWSGSDRIDVSEVVPDLELSVDQLFASLRQE